MPLALLLLGLLSGCDRRGASGAHAVLPHASSNSTSAPAPAPLATQPTARPIAGIDHVMIVSIDGLRPDVALRADAPHIRWLMAHGAFTFWARTTEMSITLPSHTSMLTGVTPPRHGVTWNSDQPLPQKYPKFPTLFELAHRVGYSTAMVTGKTKFTALARPGSVDWSDIHSVKDIAVAQAAVQIIDAHHPDVLFVHLPGDDVAGHTYGWGTPQQLEAVHQADIALGMLIDALQSNDLIDRTLIILSADHGGQGRGHGPNDVRSRHIPWIASNPHILQDYDLTQDSKLVVNTEDTFATACYVLGIPHSADIDGKPVTQMVPNRELLHGNS